MKRDAIDEDNCSFQKSPFNVHNYYNVNVPATP